MIFDATDNVSYWCYLNNVGKFPSPCSLCYLAYLSICRYFQECAGMSVKAETRAGVSLS